MTRIACCVHFAILTVSRTIAEAGRTFIKWILPFRWPSVPYARDILARDVFFSLCVLCRPAIRQSQILMDVSGLLSLPGLIGIPIDSMTVRLIGAAALPGWRP